MSLCFSLCSLEDFFTSLVFVTCVIVSSFYLCWVCLPFSDYSPLCLVNSPFLVDFSLYLPLLSLLVHYVPLCAFMHLFFVSFLVFYFCLYILLSLTFRSCFWLLPSPFSKEPSHLDGFFFYLFECKYWVYFIILTQSNSFFSLLTTKTPGAETAGDTKWKSSVGWTVSFRSGLQSSRRPQRPRPREDVAPEWVQPSVSISPVTHAEYWTRISFQLMPAGPA